MIDIRIVGQRGQGVGLAGRILASALIATGRAVIVTGAAGAGDDPEAPVMTCLHVQDPAASLPGPQPRPRFLVVLDPARLPGRAGPPVEAGGLVLVNARLRPCARMPGAAEVIAVDADAIARQAGLAPVVASAVAGAFGALSGLLALPDVVAAVERSCPTATPEHVAACEAGWHEVAGMANAGAPA